MPSLDTDLIDPSAREICKALESINLRLMAANIIRSAVITELTEIKAVLADIRDKLAH